MSRFVNESEMWEVKAPWWDRDEKVTVRRLSHGDREKIQALTRKWRTPLRATSTENGQEAERNLEIAAQHVATVTMQLGIKAWTFKDDEGNPAPVSRGMIERLSEKDADYILEAINHYNPVVTEEERESFRQSFEQPHPISEAVAEADE